MANYCYNHAIVYGKKEVLDEIEEKFNKYTDYDYLVLWGDMVLNKEVERNIKDDYCYYNTRWWDFSIDRDYEDDSMTISGDSAWAPPLQLLQELTEVYDVVVEGSYEEPGMDFAGEFKCEKGEIEDIEMTYWEYRLKDDRQYAIECLLEDLECCDWEFDTKDYPGLTSKEIEYIEEQIKISKDERL